MIPQEPGFAEVRYALLFIQNSWGTTAARKIIAQYGRVARMKDIPPEHYDAVLMACAKLEPKSVLVPAEVHLHVNHDDRVLMFLRLNSRSSHEQKIAQLEAMRDKLSERITNMRAAR